MPTVGSASRSMAMRCSADAAAHVEQRAVAAHEVHALVGVHPGRAPTASPACSATPVLHGRSRAPRRGRRRARSNSSSISRRSDVELDEAGPARVGGQLVAVLVGVEADDARLEPQRQVLGDDGDVAALVGRGCGRRRGCGGRCRRRVSAGGRPVGVLVVELDPQRAALVVDRQRLGQRAVLECAAPRGARSAWRAAQPSSGWWRLRLELGEHHDREHDLVLVEAGDRRRIGQQHRGVEHVDGPRRSRQGRR